jgi:aspartyl-tRNA(Asn)/glutamyl-tRNA(Gln) amidotransferase subunit C
MPVEITRDEVAHLARLARLALPAEDLDRLAGQLQVILSAVAQVSEAASEDVPPTTHALPMVNVFRADEPGPSLDRDLVLSQAPAAEDGRFRVPRMLEEQA